MGIHNLLPLRRKSRPNNRRKRRRLTAHTLLLCMKIPMKKRLLGYEMSNGGDFHLRTRENATEWTVRLPAKEGVMGRSQQVSAVFCAANVVAENQPRTTRE